MLFGLVLAEMEVGVKFLEILQANIKHACKHSWVQLRQWFLTGGTKHRNRGYEPPTFLGIHALKI